MMEVNLINGDCIVEMTNVPACRLLLTDIPYEEVNRQDSGLRNLDKIRYLHDFQNLYSVFSKKELAIIF